MVELPDTCPACGALPCDWTQTPTPDGTGSGEAWTCAARKQGSAAGNDPAECDWPFCGCDPYADKVLAAVEESGRLSTPKRDEEQAGEEAVERAAKAHCDFFGGEGWWDSGLIADTKPKALEAMRAALAAAHKEQS